MECCLQRTASCVALSVALLLAGQTWAGASSDALLIDESFDDLTRWADLSQVVSWNPAGVAGESAFDTTDGVLAIRSAAQERVGFSAGQTRMFQAIDHRFVYPIDRTRGTTITVDFSARWDARTLHNEGSRFVLSLNYDYPHDGLDLSREGEDGSRIDDFAFNDGAAWARPAYSLRLRALNKESLLAFGGGAEAEGNYEATPSSWLPGFIQSPGGSNNPGGGSPEVGVPGIDGVGVGRYSQSQFLDYRYVVTPDQQELWLDRDGDGEFQTSNSQGESELVGQQALGRDPISFNGVEYTRWFERIEGVRLFWRGLSGAGQAEIASLRVHVDDPSATPVGDYNGDGRVDAADYTAWRDTVGGANVTLPNDPFGGINGDDQYRAWEFNYGLEASAVPAVAPEPSASVAAALAIAPLLPPRRRHCSQLDSWSNRARLKRYSPCLPAETMPTCTGSEISG